MFGFQEGAGDYRRGRGAIFEWHAVWICHDGGVNQALLLLNVYQGVSPSLSMILPLEAIENINDTSGASDSNNFIAVSYYFIVLLLWAERAIRNEKDKEEK